MSVETTDDWAGRAVDFGYNMSTYRQHFDPHSHLYSGPMEMRSAADYDNGDRCLCPGCASEGWYATSPLCRFWRSDCFECSGTRRPYDYSLRRRVECEACAEYWGDAVRWFRLALRSPRAAARKLREPASS